MAGHRTTYGHPFYSLDVLKAGDKIVLTTFQGIFVYDTTSSQVVSPSDGAILENKSGAWVTLTTCNPRFSAATRLVVTAKLVHSALFVDAPVPPSKPTHTKVHQKGHPETTANGRTRRQLQRPGARCRAVGTGGGRRPEPSPCWLRIATAAAVGSSTAVASSFRLVLLYFFFTAISPLLPASL